MHTTTKGKLMRSPNTHIFTPGRIVALVLIAVLAGGLAFLRFGPDGGSVSVPSGAKPGDLILEDCEYGTENGAYAADCGTLVVPENRADPQSRLIALPVTRIHARTDHRAEPIFRLEGGPGKTNMKFENASRLAQNRDVVLVGYRGADGSSVLDCPEVESALKHSSDFLGEKSFRSYGAAFRSCADRLTDDGVDLAGYTVAQRVDDLEAARVALGYDRIDLLSESAGTRYAMVYSWRYPKSIHRSVMIGVNPPGNFLWDAKTTDEQIARYAELCSKDADCSKRTDDLAATMSGTDIPKRWGFLPIKEANVRLATFYGLVESTSKAAPISAPMTLGSWTSAADGDASGFWLQSLLADVVFPKSFIWGEMAAMGQADDRAAQRYFSSGDHHPGTEFIWGGGELVTGWPSSSGEGEYDRVRTSNVETLLISGELDFATPPQVATKELLPHLPNGHQVVLDGIGHSGSFWAEQPEAGTRLINTFLDSGRVDDSLYEPGRVDFTPEVTQTALAKGFAGAMAGLALLTILSLVWMARRVRKRGGFGRKASTALRAVYPIVLGLGGWFLGVLIVITTMPGVPLDDEVLAVLSVGLPIGLGIYYGWVDGDRSSRTRTAGLVAAMVGALVGAWLGFNATADLAALVTAIVGAAVGANLVLLAYDIARERSARALAPATPPRASAPVEA
jgi:pimeloyl-ACP methyl ester carboxylesterase